MANKIDKVCLTPSPSLTTSVNALGFALGAPEKRKLERQSAVFAVARTMNAGGHCAPCSVVNVVILLAETDAVAKLLIQKIVFTQKEFIKQIEMERAIYQKMFRQKGN